MARLFDDASSEYLERDEAPVTAAPCTFACWFESDSIALSQTLVWLGDKDSEVEYMSLQASGGIAGDGITAYCKSSSGGTDYARTTTGYSANVWHHACGVWAAANSRAAYLDGGSKDTDTATNTPSGLDRVSLGRIGHTTPVTYVSGAMAEVAIWNVALSDDEVAALAAGLCPLFLHAANLVAYWPLGGIYDPSDGDHDILGNYPLTAYNTPGTTDHCPRMIYPSSATILAPQAPQAYELIPDFLRPRQPRGQLGWRIDQLW